MTEQQKPNRILEADCLQIKGDGCGQCRAWNAAQNQIGVRLITDENMIERIRKKFCGERCPAEIVMDKLNPANLTHRQNLW